MYIIFFLSQFIAIFLGCICGIFQIKGFIGFIIFVLGEMIFFTSYLNYLGLDEEEFGGRMTLLKDSLVPMIASFLIPWILIYSVFA
eukprot:TRINITY_DN1366_c0_g1_i2.p1 TRINITY_DN1366_c0_g1~~TRINITY_DN1366_c0_g1_i2.p1  ORF type:complete len:86 (+),score=18.67 TRINITY_DN1366_c0_g1_i2:140-397(+)